MADREQDQEDCGDPIEQGGAHRISSRGEVERGSDREPQRPSQTDSLVMGQSDQIRLAAKPQQFNSHLGGVSG